jgi:hypothetical protein
VCRASHLQPAALSSILPVSEVRQHDTRSYLKSSNPATCAWAARRRSSAREELLAWAKARDFRDRATEYLNRARVAADDNVQRRFIDIARHYRTLAAAEASNADRLGDERRGQSETSQSRSPDGTIEIQTLRLKLQLFASQQTDQTVRSQCLAVDTKLAELLAGDDPTLRQVLANSVKQLEEALWRPMIEEATVHFLTGLRGDGSRSLSG